MTPPTCGACGQAAAPAKTYEIDGKLYCEPCANSAVSALKASAQKFKITRYVDKSVCARCTTYIGEGSNAVQVGGSYLCQACAAMVENWPYPQWLKASLAGRYR